MRFRSTAKGAVLWATSVHSTRLNLVLLAYNLIPLQFFLLRIGSSIIILSLAQALELLGKGQQENSVCKDSCLPSQTTKFYVYYPQSRMRKPGPAGCPLTSACISRHNYTHPYTHSHIHYNILKRFQKVTNVYAVFPASSQHTLELTPAELRRTLKSVPRWDSPLSSLTSFSVSWYRSQLETIFLLEKFPGSSFSSPWVSESLSSSTCNQ